MRVMFSPAMKDVTKSECEATRHAVPAEVAIEFCLHQLYSDNQHQLEDSVVEDLSFFEVITALLLARDTLRLQPIQVQPTD